MLLTLTTDFGPSSPYVAAMKGVILSLNPRGPAGRPDACRAAARHSPGGDCARRGHPLVSARHDPRGRGRSGRGQRAARSIYARIGQQQYLAPDNGLLSRLARHAAPLQSFTLPGRNIGFPQVSATFHGRDILAPVAAHLSLGVAPEALGEPADGTGDFGLGGGRREHEARSRESSSRSTRSAT